MKLERSKMSQILCVKKVPFRKSGHKCRLNLIVHNMVESSADQAETRKE